MEKCGTLQKGRHNWKNASHLENGGTLGKERYTWKSVAHLEKRATFEKMRHTWKNSSHLSAASLEKFNTLGKGAPHLKKERHN